MGRNHLSVENALCADYHGDIRFYGGVLLVLWSMLDHNDFVGRHASHDLAREVPAAKAQIPAVQLYPDSGRFADDNSAGFRIADNAAVLAADLPAGAAELDRSAVACANCDPAVTGLALPYVNQAAVSLAVLAGSALQGYAVMVVCLADQGHALRLGNDPGR